MFKALRMDGLLVKPLTARALLDALQAHAWSRREARDAGGVPCAPADIPAIDPVLSAERILELRGNLPPRTFVTLVEACLVDLDQCLPGLRRAFAVGSVRAITTHAHAMVGMAAGYGMPALETALRAIMAAAQAGDTAALGPAAMVRAEAELAAAACALREIMQDVVA